MDLGDGSPKVYDLRRFACEHVGLSRDYKPSKLVAKVQRSVVEPLEADSFLVRMEPKDRFVKRPTGRYDVAFALHPSVLEQRAKEAAGPALAKLEAEERADIDEVVLMLTGNLEKIAEHGRRADGIVKSMLAHSRESSGARQLADINALVEEALNLAYHGARAQDQNFNITLERDLDHNIAPIELVPQDVMSVFLNLFGNGFYAAAKRERPVLKVTTRAL